MRRGPILRRFSGGGGRLAMYLFCGLLILYSLPESIHLLYAHAAQLASLPHYCLFHFGEASQELVVGTPQCFLSVDAHPLPQVHQGEQQVAKLLGAALFTFLTLKLVYLLADL